MKNRQRKLFMMMGAAGLLLLGTAALQQAGVPGFGGGDANADGRSEPGVAGDNPCLNRELQTPESVRAYYASIGMELQNQGDPRFLEFNQADDAWVEMVKVVVLEAMYVDPSNEASAFADPRVPTEGYDAWTYWCTGGDVSEDGTVTWRYPELVKNEPIQYKAGKAYWVLYETDRVIVAILVDCHNLIVIPKGPPPTDTTPSTTTPGPTTPTTSPTPTTPETTPTTTPETTPETTPTTTPETTPETTPTTAPGTTTTSIHPPASGPPPAATIPSYATPTTPAPTVFVPPQGPPPAEGQLPPPAQDGGYDSGSEDGSGTPNGGSCQLDANGNCIDGTVEGGGPDPDTDDNDPVVDTGTYGGMPTD